MSMSRDGLLPGLFSRIHRKYNTPYFATIVSGFVVGVPALFMNLTEVTDLTSIGTLFAFVLVCGGILLVDQHKVNHRPAKGFRVPYYNAKYILPVLLLLGLGLALYFNPEGVQRFFSSSDGTNSGWDVVKHRLPMYGFLVVCLGLVYFSFTKNLSLIPVLGLLTNLYLMTELGITNWSRFLLWLALGLIIYFGYSYWHSKLRTTD
jgi:amino acid transporter